MSAPVRLLDGTMEMIRRERRLRKEADKRTKEAKKRTKEAKKRTEEAKKRAEEALAATLRMAGAIVDIICEQSSDPEDEEEIWGGFWSTVEGTGKNTMSKEETRNLFETAWKNRESADGQGEEC